MLDLIEIAEIGPRPRALPVWGTASSFALHVALGLVLLAVPMRHLVVTPPQPVTVRIITPAEFAALQPAPPAATEPVPDGATLHTPSDAKEAEQSLASPLQPRPTPSVTATQFYAAAILREPGMARIRQTFGTLARSEQLVQLCNIEGLEQIRRGVPGSDPDTLVSYAMADYVADGLTLVAPGGAFRAARHWYRVSFRCTVGADFASVTAFTFTPGEMISRDQWDAHDLNAADAEE